MTERRKRNWWPLLLSVVLTSFVWWVASLVQSLGPLPYINATIDVRERTADHVDLEYSFEKLDDCRFIRQVFFGEILGSEMQLDHIDLGGEKDDTRQVGQHFTVIRVYTGSGDYDSIKVYTEHDCKWRDAIRKVERKFGEVAIPPAPARAAPVQSVIEEQRAIIEELQQQIETLSQEVTK